MSTIAATIIAATLGINHIATADTLPTIPGGISLPGQEASADTNRPSDPHAAIPKNFDGQGEPIVLAGDSDVASSLEASQKLLEEAPVLMVADDTIPQVMKVAYAGADALKVPLIITTGEQLSDEVRSEIERLNVKTLITAGLTETIPGVRTITLPVDGTLPEDIMKYKVEEFAKPNITVFVADDAESLAGARIAEAAGATMNKDIPGGDLRATKELRALAKETKGQQIVAVGESFEGPEEFAYRYDVAVSDTELPGGGQLMFPGRRLIALYGNPANGRLGLLGEQGLEESIVRAKQYAKQYEALTDEPVVPSFEIIVTVASGPPGSDGNYSREINAEEFLPWVKRAQEEGMYVVLDLQPGRTDFLTQAKQYESLLKYPHVGLALDPEWRLKSNQVHLRQIGSVQASEINEVREWLTELVRKERLPQKLMIVHQFKGSMVVNRKEMKGTNAEVAMMIHVDGQGPVPAKFSTWKGIRENAPNVYWGWKNFIDEDKPKMLTPKETYDKVKPLPELVTYQ